jgi:hypothetical protein
MGKNKVWVMLLIALVFVAAVVVSNQILSA